MMAVPFNQLIVSIALLSLWTVLPNKVVAQTNLLEIGTRHCELKSELKALSEKHVIRVRQFSLQRASFVSQIRKTGLSQSQRTSLVKRYVRLRRLWALYVPKVQNQIKTFEKNINDTKNDIAVRVQRGEILVTSSLSCEIALPPLVPTISSTPTSSPTPTPLITPTVAPSSACNGPVSRDFSSVTSYSWPSSNSTHQVTTSAASGPGSLSALLSSVGSDAVISFNPTLKGATIPFNQIVQIKSSLILDGRNAPGITLDGGSQSGILNVASRGVNVTVIGIRFINGRSTGPGGAIEVGQDGSSLTVVGSIFEGNVGNPGGAIRIGYASTGVILDSFFLNNDDSAGKNGFSGGAIATNGSGALRIERSRFVGNKGWISGAVYNLLEPITIEDSVFLSNQGLSPMGAGAVFVDGGNRIGPSNTSVPGVITLKGSHFESNKGRGYGGAGMLWGYPKDVITIKRNNFISNQVDRGEFNSAKGGALRIQTRDALTISESSFYANKADHQGGALWLDGDGPIKIENSTLSNNVVVDDMGGAITFNNNGPVLIEHSTITNNVSGRACGAFWFGDPNLNITIKNSIVTNNLAEKDHSQDQIGYQPRDGGGNIEFPAPRDGGRRVAAASRIVDPLIASPMSVNGSLLRPLTSASPAINTAVSSSLKIDGSNAPRDSTPDVGAVEFGAQCKG